jgi:hypothetical protein
MKRRTWPIVFGVFAFVVLSAGECNIGDLGGLINKPGSITVTNTGTEPAVVAIVADDVKTYPTIASGGSASAQTNVGGRYTVSVTMTAQQIIEYKSDLQDLRRTVEKLIDGTASAEEKVYAFTSLAGIKAALGQLNAGGGASCSGNIKLSQEDAVSVSASVRWVTQSGSGFWDLTCGSSE